MERSITSEDIQKLPRIRDLIRKEAKYIESLYEYARENYCDECYRYCDECPDETDLSDELYYRQIYVWFMSEKVIPSKGRTILEEFVEKFVAEDDPDVAEGLLRMGNVIRGSFRIVNMGHYPFLLVDHLESGERYVTVSRIEPYSEAKKLFRVGGIVKGKIYPWWGAYYMFNGVLSRKQSDEEFFRRTGLILDPGILMEGYERAQVQRHESISVSRRMKLSSAMNKFPSYWVDAMCSAVGIDTRRARTKPDKVRSVVAKLENGYARELLWKKFTKEQLAALKKIYQGGWVIKYGQLTRQFSSDVCLFWNEHPPTTDIGILRQHGFVVVGTLPEEGRHYRVGLIPLELRPQVEEFFSSVTSR